ncbi:MAG: outer membrane beta-barrel protein [Saprospiraceae bacterium]|nr:outer membrane beta-barrel protein [Saprospiraceae bacterium]
MNHLRCICLFMLIWTNVSLLAQQKGRLSLGPRLGVNLSNVNLEEADRVSGLAGGIQATYLLGPASALSIEAIYAEEGYEVSTSTISYRYMQFPIMYNSLFGLPIQAFRPKLAAGLAPSFLLDAKVNDVDFTDQNKSFVLNFIGGVGFDYRIISRVSLIGDARILIGLSDIEINPSASNALRNRTYQFSLGVLYSF